MERVTGYVKAKNIAYENKKSQDALRKSNPVSQMRVGHGVNVARKPGFVHKMLQKQKNFIQRSLAQDIKVKDINIEPKKDIFGDDNGIESTVGAVKNNTLGNVDSVEEKTDVSNNSKIDWSALDDRLGKDN